MIHLPYFDQDLDSKKMVVYISAQVLFEMLCELTYIKKYTKTFYYSCNRAIRGASLFEEDAGGCIRSQSFGVMICRIR